MVDIKIFANAILRPDRPSTIDVPALIKIKPTAMVEEKWK